MHEVLHFVDHAPDLGRILMHPGVPDALETQGAHRPLVTPFGAHDAPYLRDLEGAHSVIFTPRVCSMSALERSLWSPSTVARTRFTEVVEPSAWGSTSFAPAGSRAALAPP